MVYPIVLEDVPSQQTYVELVELLHVEIFHSLHVLQLVVILVGYKDTERGETIKQLYFMTEIGSVQLA